MCVTDLGLQRTRLAYPSSQERQRRSLFGWLGGNRVPWRYGLAARDRAHELLASVRRSMSLDRQYTASGRNAQGVGPGSLHHPAWTDTAKMAVPILTFPVESTLCTL